MKKLKNKKTKSSNKYQLEDLIIKAKRDWKIGKFVKKGAYFISNPENLLEL